MSMCLKYHSQELLIAIRDPKFESCKERRKEVHVRDLKVLLCRFNCVNSPFTGSDNY